MAKLRITICEAVTAGRNFSGTSEKQTPYWGQKENEEMLTQEQLKQRNYVLCLDRSGSMDEPVAKGSSQTRWKYAQEAMQAVARKCAELDDDGIDVYTFNKSFERFANTTPDKVADIFAKVSPQGGTDFVPVLNDVLDNHFKTSDKKATTVLVLTDGEPSDGAAGQSALAKAIIAAANKIEVDAELAIQFIQIGTDPAATAFLKKLDDELVAGGAKFDIVDAKTADDLEKMSITDALLAAVND